MAESSVLLKRTGVSPLESLSTATAAAAPIESKTSLFWDYVSASTLSRPVSPVALPASPIFSSAPADVPKRDKDRDRTLSSTPYITSSQSNGNENLLRSNLQLKWLNSDLRRLRLPQYVPRLCQLQVSQIKFLRKIAQPVDAVELVIALCVPPRSRRTFRSPKVVAPKTGQLIDLPVDFSFAVQYCHHVSTENNVLQLTIVRRKRRTRQLAGVCTAVISLDDSIQHIVNKQIMLHPLSSKYGVAPICYLDIHLTSTSINDEFIKQAQNDLNDLKDDSNFLSDDDEEIEEELKREPKPQQAPPARRGIASRFTSLLKPRRRKESASRVEGEVANDDDEEEEDESHGANRRREVLSQEEVDSQESSEGERDDDQEALVFDEMLLDNDDSDGSDDHPDVPS